MDSPRLDYEALVSGLPDALVGVDTDLRIILWNPAAEELLGRSARRVTGRALKEVFPPETSLVRHLTDTLATGESRSESSAVIEGPDGRPVHVSLVTAPLAGRSGAVTSAVAVVRDISRLRQLESEVRRGETLAAAGQMAVGLAHEIRNPLSAIRGAVQLMQRELGDEATSLGVQFVRRYDPSLPPIMADEDRIVQVFHNLVRNAIEAMPGGGRLTLVTRLSMNPLFAKVDLGQGQKSLAEIQIADEGLGMAA